jgi:hypothetical protein
MSKNLRIEIVEKIEKHKGRIRFTVRIKRFNFHISSKMIDGIVKTLDSKIIKIEPRSKKNLVNIELGGGYEAVKLFNKLDKGSKFKIYILYLD